MIGGDREVVAQGIDSLPVIRLVDSDDAVFDDWLQLRKDYVQAQGWRAGEEFDRYDNDPQTLQVVMTRNDEVTAGVRLTPFDSIEDTLSWSMLTDDMRADAMKKLPQLLDHVSRWDMTRLVVSSGLPRREAFSACLEVLGAAQAVSRADDDPRWFFTTTLPFFLACKRQGLEFHLLTMGKINTDDMSESVFCYADPVNHLRFLEKTHEANHQAALQGVAAVAVKGMV